MPTFISTLKWTDHGMRNFRETCDRAEAFRQTAETMGAVVSNIFWTLGPFDGLAIFEAPNEETATALMLEVGSKGSVQTQTTRAFDAKEMRNVVERLPS